jgi:hypothetical protein
MAHSVPWGATLSAPLLLNGARIDRLRHHVEAIVKTYNVHGCLLTQRGN